MPPATEAAAQDGRKALVYARKYKTSLCRTFMTNGTCEYGTSCSFAHGFEELRRASSLQSQQQVSELLPVPKIIKARSASFNSHENNGQKAPVLNRFASFTHQKDGQDNNVNNNLYHTELCRTFSTIGFCPYGDSCQFAHGPQQLRKKSQKSVKSDTTVTPTTHNKEQHHVARRSTFIRDRRTYKTELCRQWQQTGRCDYDNQCQFAHGVEQLRSATDAIVLPPEETVGHAIPTSIRSISTHQIPAFTSDLKTVQITLSPSITDHSEENAQKKSICNPQLFKTAICRTYSQFGSCPYEHKCRFAHGLSDLRPVPRFKSMSSVGPTSAPTTSQIFSAFQKSGDDAQTQQRSHSTSPVVYPIKQ